MRGPAPPDGEAAASDDVDHLRVEVGDQRGVLVDPEDPGILGQQRLHRGQPTLAEIAEVRVVRASLGIVVVGNDHARAREADRPQQVEAVEPVHLLAHLVIIREDGIGK